LYRSTTESLEEVLDWSPDGNEILCKVGIANGKHAMELFHLEKRQTTPVRLIDDSDFSARFSPDGKSIAYESVQHGKRRVFVMSVDGHSEFALGSANAEYQAPIWTRDGARLLFVSNRSGRWDLWSVAARDGRPIEEPRMVYPEIGVVQRFPGWTDDHTMIYSRDEFPQAGGNVLTVGIDPASGTLTSEPKAVIPYFVGHQRDAGWSPDGQKIAFVTRDNRAKLYVYTPATGNLQQVPTGELVEFSRGRWDPSGDSIAVWSRKSLYRVSLSGNIHELYTREARFRTVGTMDKDWRLYSYGCTDNADDPESRKICVYDLMHRKIVREMPLPPDREMRQPRLSEDGKWLYYLLGKSDDRTPQQIMAAPVTGGESRVLTSVAEHIHAWGISPDGNYIAYSLVSDEKMPGASFKGTRLFIVPTSGGTPQQVELPNWDGRRQFNWSPDGKQIGYVSADHPEQWLAVSNFLPTEDAKQGQ
jgi:Tol biopolymer transport system component